MLREGQNEVLQGFRYAYELRVRWSEVDGQHIVFNANYMSYLDLAYAEYLRRGVRALEGLPQTVVVKTTLQFHKSAHFDDNLHIWVRTVRIGKSSMTVEFAITRDDERLFEAETIYVYLDPATNTSATVPNSWREAIAVFEQGR